MATLITVMKRMWALPESEAPAWVKTSKQSGRTVEQVHTEFRANMPTIRNCAPTPSPRTAVRSVPLVSPALIDVENRRRLLALGREVYSDKSFRDAINSQLSERSQHQTQLEDIKNIGRALLGEE